MIWSVCHIRNFWWLVPSRVSLFARRTQCIGLLQPHAQPQTCDATTMVISAGDSSATTLHVSDPSAQLSLSFCAGNTMLWNLSHQTIPRFCSIKQRLSGMIAFVVEVMGRRGSQMKAADRTTEPVDCLLEIVLV